MMIVLDASALLAYLQDEPGNDAVEAVLAKVVISSVNWAEVIQKSIAASVDVESMHADLAALGLTILPFTPEESEIAGKLWRQTRQHGLSLGEHACLSLGVRLNAQVLTTDKIWTALKLPIAVSIVR